MLLEDSVRLKKIDELYALRLDQSVSLPLVSWRQAHGNHADGDKLVVVGDQSSGKSSVLEALTGLPLPRDTGLCTRFATQILFKRSETERVEVNIIPATGHNDQKKDELFKFTQRYSKASGVFDQASLVDVLIAAAQIMGVPGVRGTCMEGMKSFSNDLLKIEMSGPKYEHFSVVDLPGLFRKPTPGQTTKEDMILVRQMVSGYLNNTRSIILAVVPANVDIATQEIVQMAEDADPHRKRTLGVLTKPDLVDRGAESKIIELLMNGGESVGLGYIAVCNRSQSDLVVPLAERHAKEEEFFNGPIWGKVPKERVGVTALKRCLDNLLVNVTRLNFGDVVRDIDQRSLTTKTQLEQLGAPRMTSEAQRLFLLHLASRFQSLIGKATDAHYGRGECFRKHSELRLAAIVMDENDRFSAMISRRGIHRPFTANNSTDSESDEEQGTPALANVNEESLGDDESSELHGLLEYPSPEPVQSGESVEAWIERLYHDFRGFEVGTGNASLISTLVYEQTRGWTYYAQHHVSQVIAHIHRCIRILLKHICSDANILNRLWERMLPSLRVAYERAVRHNNFLLATEREGYPITVNHYFAATLKKMRMARIESRLRAMESWQTSDVAREPLLRVSDTLKACVSNERHNVEDINDVLRSYLKVARKRFVDNVCKQVVDHYLICSPQGPLAVFSPEFIGRLEEMDLEQIAGEDHNVTMQRHRLETEMKTLAQGRKILRA